jgi:uncharacterized protein with PIN domain
VGTRLVKVYIHRGINTNMDYSQSRIEECTDEDLNFVKCPECGRDDLSAGRGVTMHFGYNHEGSLAYLFRCEECGRLAFGNGQKNTFCSKWCEIYNQTGTFKHFDEEYLREQIEEDGKTVTEVAEELGVGMKTVSKWALEYEIGNEYECPSCGKSFSSKQSVSKHHYDKHGESISGKWYTCKNCGEEFWDMKCGKNHITPKYCGMGCRKTGSKSVEFEPLGHKLDSTWELEIDKLLYSSDLEYQHESEIFHIDGTKHKPDFISSDWILEVKSAGGYRDKKRWNKIGRYLKEEENREYVIVGGEGVNMPCNKFIKWEDREQVIGVLE